MTKVLQVALREFLATVSSRAFIIGLLIAPLMGLAAATLLPRLMNGTEYHASGEVAVIDPDGRVAAALGTILDPAEVARSRQRDAERLLKALPPAAGAVVGDAARRQLRKQTVDLRLVVRPADADPRKEKTWLYAGGPNAHHFALVVVHADAVAPKDGSATYGSYDLFIPSHLDNRAVAEVQRSVGEALVAARARAHSLDPDTVRALTTVARVAPVTVDPAGAHRGGVALNFLLPLAFGALMFMGVIMGGQALLTSTIEEKSSRVIEVLLSAVSPMQLMAGKLLGQMAVSIVALGLYVAMGLALLTAFALLGLVDLGLVGYLVIFFVITYLVVGSLMMAMGSAVNELREAQSLVMPIMLVIMVPWLTWLPISRDPNSTFSVAMSFIPPVNTFAMMLRMASSSPPPLWQVWLSIGVGVAAVFAALWFAAKVFRIGLLMHGKPPDLATLIRWVRAA